LSDHDGESVGYKQPPKKNRFKKGHSGNPRGRKKINRTYDATLRELLDARMAFVIDGKKHVMTGREALGNAIAKLVAAGNVPMIKILRHYDMLEPAPKSIRLVISEEDRDL
jgi:hypothetical protein